MRLAVLVRPRLGLPAALLIAAASCDPAARGATQVKMHDNAFIAPVVRIPTGAGVAFANIGRNPHNIVPVDPAKWPTGFDTSAVAPGALASLTLTEPGVYEFYCAYHGTRDGRGMAGAIVVGDAAYSGGTKGRTPAVAHASGTTRLVPKQYATIQAAIDGAAPGDLVLIDSGTYREEVTITTPSLVVRGVDRNAVVIDGEFIRPNGFNVLADAVAIENLTARNHTFNGVFWNGVTGYRGRYLTAHNNGDYGIYAFDSKDGLLEDSYASGSPDAGFYVGQCDPCNAVIRRVIAEHNTLGYSGTNSSGELYILSSIWRRNRGGLVPNSLDTELYPPQHGTVIRANLIHDNNSSTAPGKGLGPLAQGMGVVLGGGRDNIVEDNVILDHEGVGVMIAPFVDANWWPATGNVVAGNLFLNSGRADISVGGPTSAANCIAIQGREETTLAPRWMTCGDSSTRVSYVIPDSGPGHPPPAMYGTASGVQNDLVPLLALAFRMWRLRDATWPDYRTQPVPPPQPSMPEARTAPALPAHGEFARVRPELANAALPPGTDSVIQAARARNAPPAGTPRFGRAVAQVQAWFPLTPRLIALVLLLIACARVGLRWLEARHGDGIVRWVRLWKVASVAGVLGWVGLALVTAVSFSAM